MHGLRSTLIIGLLWGGSLAALAGLPPDSMKTGRVSEILREMSPLDADEVLWIAKCIFSESDRPNEQRLVAWVVRNRVETAYRGRNYRDVVLEHRQFSAFNTPSPRRDYILVLNQNSTVPEWQEALQIALDVFHADSLARPFPITTRHFYSPISMTENETPEWVAGNEPLDVRNFNIDPHRFRFYSGIDDIPELYVPASQARTSVDRIISSRDRHKSSYQGRVRRSLKTKIPRPSKPKMQSLIMTE